MRPALIFSVSFCFFLTDRSGKLCAHRLQFFLRLLILLLQLHAVLIKMLQLFQTLFLFFQRFFGPFQASAILCLQAPDQVQTFLGLLISLLIKIELSQVFSIA